MLAKAQINRSATELARENIRNYLTDKIFKNAPYLPVSYGELKPQHDRSAEIKWTIVHKFKITEAQLDEDKKVFIQKPYDFIFYLDDKMKVLTAMSYFDSE
jgi:hypothetical protein